MTSKIYSPREIARLILASIRRTATEEEKCRLELWLTECKSNRDFYERLKDEQYRSGRLAEFVRFNSREDWRKVRVGFRRRRNIFRRLLPYAAVLVVGLAVWGGVWISSQPGTKVVVVQNEIGCAQARLLLPDGSRIDLSAGENTLNNADFVSDGHTLVYTDSVREKAPEKHTLQIPRGGEYHLILSDGTEVWLNSETELRYPDHFTGNSREVELSGEAYFEVAKNASCPFYVKTTGMQVQVLGTSFNVRAYPGEQRRTTLVEGRVAVGFGDQRIEILPGEQLILSENEAEVRQVNVAYYTAWREYRFAFDDQYLVEVLKNLERWYDVHFLIHDDEIKTMRFTGNLPKYEDIDKILEIIELATCVKFDINDRTIAIRIK